MRYLYKDGESNHSIILLGASNANNGFCEFLVLQYECLGSTIFFFDTDFDDGFIYHS
jgi:hypothetical protein